MDGVAERSDDTALEPARTRWAVPSGMALRFPPPSKTDAF